MNTDKAKPHSRPLRRGKACLNCRHLKIKCDGVRPLCGPCARVPKEDPCEFTDITSRTKELEDTVYRLQSRINELESMPSSSTSYSQRFSLSGSPPPQSSAGSSPFSGSSVGSRSSPHSSSENSFLGIQEPPLVMIQMLLDYFLPHATQFGFFLHIDRFRNSAMLSLPFGDARRPSPALLCVVYLWGVYLSHSQPLLASEPAFLKRAQQHISTEISASNDAKHILHAIQAQVLLSTYLFRNKRFLEAEFHANGAATLVLGYQLHKIRSPRPGSPNLLGVPVLSEVYPGPPQDVVEEGEQIRGFWAVTCLQSNLNVALSSASSTFSILESPGTEIDTPWPLEIADYEAGRLPSGQQSQETIRAFLTEDPPKTSPPCMLYAKASVLLHRASRLGSKWSPNLPPQEFSSFMNSYTWLDQRITKFWETLPPLYDFYNDAAAARTLVVAHALTAAAAIKLHRNPSAADPEAQKKCVFAASAIIAALADTNIADFTTAHPIVGSLCMMGCRILMDEIRKAHMFRASWAQSLGLVLPPPSPVEAALTADLQNGITTMTMYAVGSPLIKYQLAKLQQQYEALY
ncbi:hypothetical protein B0H10DRAFT_2019704 [Mycena sp. CBHHK59/15]|nr:hypothetical protein B0H10DRAFT_2019704 [Mycena sp. CBHHK59/15]